MDLDGFGVFLGGGVGVKTLDGPSFVIIIIDGVHSSEKMSQILYRAGF